MDVLIIGGGPAGLAAAIAMRQRGLQVTVADGMQPPIDKACGEGLMPDSRRDLAKLGIELSVADGAEFHGIHFANSESGDHVTAGFRHGPGLGVRRLRLHQLLVERARECGVLLRWNSPVQFSPTNSLKPGLSIGGERLTYRYLIGADGQTSRVRRFAGLDRGTLLSQRFGFRAHYRIAPWNVCWHVSSNVSGTRSGPHVEVHWGRTGQAYVTPVDDDEICVAVMSRDSSMRIDSILEGLPFLRDRLRGAECVSRERGAVTTTRRLRRVATGNTALIGDASGSADAITGEGMAMAFRQAVLLAAAIEQDNLELYSTAHTATVRMPQTMARIMLLMDRYPFFRDRALRMLARQPELFAHMLDVHLGDESLPRFVRSNGLRVGWGLLAPAHL
jgi:flavin-dependent dehydrogenase